MKTIMMILLFVPFWASSIGQKTNTKGLLEKPDTRNEIYNTIMNNHQYMTEFMNAMHTNDHAMMMMRNNFSMMGQESTGHMGMSGQNNMNGQESTGQMGMSGQNNMMGMMMNNPEMMHTMMETMMEMCKRDSTYCNQFAEMMSEHPHMTQKVMQQMKKDGKPESQGDMNMMRSGMQQEKHQQHYK